MEFELLPRKQRTVFFESFDIGIEAVVRKIVENGEKQAQRTVEIVGDGIAGMVGEASGGGWRAFD